jgi:hypothetical protein
MKIVGSANGGVGSGEVGISHGKILTLAHPGRLESTGVELAESYFDATGSRTLQFVVDVPPCQRTGWDAAEATFT